MLFEMFLLRFNVSELIDVAAFLHPPCFSVYSSGSFRSSRCVSLALKERWTMINIGKKFAKKVMFKCVEDIMISLEVFRRDR